MLKQSISIGSKYIGSHYRPFIVAEMSGNHNQSLERALKIVEAAAKAGVDALKLQTYTADTMTLDIDKGDFFISDPKSLWKNTSLYKLYQKAHTPWEWHKPIFDRCQKLGIIGFSTPFDESAVDFLESLNVPCYKIASFENIDIPLIRKVASTGKPLMISTGMASSSEIEETVKTVRQEGCAELILLKCTSAYPATADTANLMTIPHMREHFQCHVGLSDHTMGIGVAIASIAMGAMVIEKHFTLNRNDGGVDASFSLEPHEMQVLVIESRQAWKALGKVSYGPTEQEKASLQYRKSLYIVKDIKKGEVLTKQNLKAIRPGYGLSPLHYDHVLGKTIKISVSKGTPLSWDLLF